MQNERLKVAPRTERGVYLDDVTFEGYVGYKVVGSGGVMLLRSCVHESKVDSETEALFWKWLNLYDPPSEQPSGYLTLVSG